jgi:D-glycero-beta-D-manno-heptose-7-phosphate kinase
MSVDIKKFQKSINSLSSTKKILTVGDVGIDKYIFGEVSRISPEAPVPVLRVTKKEKKLGMSANICNNLNALGVKNSLISIIGNDENGRLLKRLLEEKSTETKFIVTDDDSTTISKDRVLTSVQQICRIDHEDEFFSFGELALGSFYGNFEKALNGHDGVILEDYSKGVLNAESIQRLIHLCREKGVFVAVDPGKGKPAYLYQGASLLKPNYLEAKELVHSMGYEQCPIEKMGEILIDKLSLDRVVITLGHRGMAMWDKKEGYNQIPTVAQEVYDVSGAGDTVISVITAGIVNGLTLLDACWLANIAAGVVVSKKGTAVVNTDEMLKLFNKLNIN